MTDSVTTELRPSIENQSLPLCVGMLFCDNVIIGKDDACSLIRIIDNASIPPGVKPADGSVIELSMIRMVMIFKQGDAVGDYQVSVAATDPRGTRTTLWSSKLPISEATMLPEAGCVVVGLPRIKWGGYGLYWIEAFIDERAIAKTPIRIVPASIASAATAVSESTSDVGRSD